VGLFLLRYADPEALEPIYQRLSIPVWYLLVLTVQTLILLVVERFGLHFDALADLSATLRAVGVALAILLVLVALVAITRIGLQPDSAYWGEPGVPLMGWQLAAALLTGCGLTVLEQRRTRTAPLDAYAVVSLWLAAAVIWLGVPLTVMHNSFYMPMGPPSQQAFPSSDAGYYDSMAQSLRIGYPYLGEIPTRPLYVVFLALLHLLFGEHYDWIVVGQTLVLALIPVALYLLATKLHSRAAGITIAMMAILREQTSLLVSSQTRVSNTKTLLVDLPTLLLILVACLLVVRWMHHRDALGAILAGGAFGSLLLLRTQAVLILAVLIPLLILGLERQRKRSARGLAVFAVAIALTVAPWLVHNYVVSGHVAFDAPFQYQIIASQYRYAGNLDLTTVDLQGKSLAATVLDFAVRDPKFFLGFVATHFMATQIDGVLALPLLEPYRGLRAPINLYWLKWSGNLGWSNMLLIFGYLAMIAVGLGAAWRRAKWAGLVPLAFSLGYSLANGLGRFSGWRYDLPADWVAYFYFGIGFAQVLGGLLVLLGVRQRRIHPDTGTLPHPGSRPAAAYLALFGFIAVGALPWLAQTIVSPRYLGLGRQQLVHELATSSYLNRLGIRRQDVEAFASLPGTTIRLGRVLYPRFFSRNTGLASAHPWPAYAPRDFPRLGFLLLNEARSDVVFPTRRAPAQFVHGEDAIVLGCPAQEYTDARLVLFRDSGAAYLSGPLDAPCP
jgi:hypothetical protein